jgi:UDP-GlcNAc:undecaprenyl-phosphate/decaprenyl-phosphate GlcNAc-1-phosphate transferase
VNAYLLTFSIAAGLSLWLTRLCRDMALRAKWVDLPDTTRKFHAGPVPAVGGVALSVSTIAALAIAWLVSSWSAAPLRGDPIHVLPVCALGVLMMLVGLVDDQRSLRAVWKFMLQAALAVAAWSAGIRIESLGAYWGDGFRLEVWSLPITVLWIVGITNAFNLLDGIDGLAAGAALFATLAMLGVAISSDQMTTALMLTAVAGATAAFLRYNFNPASIFLGDSGSLFLGFTLSVLAIESSQKSAAAFAVAVPIVSLGVPVLDTMVVVFRRLVSGRPVFSGDRRHIHHMLLARGLSVRQVAMGMYAVSGALALVSLLVASPSASLVGPVLVILGVTVAIGVQQLRIPELRVLSSHVARSLSRQRSQLARAAVVETMLTDLEQAADAHQTLKVVGQGLADSGFAAATLSVPVWFDIPSGEEVGWRVSHGASPRVLERSLQWVGQPAGGPALTIVALPLFDDERPGSLSISTQADDWHQASLINWLRREVAQTVGVHLARTADQSAFESGAHPFGEAISSRSGTYSVVVPHGRGPHNTMARFGNWGRR